MSNELLYRGLIRNPIIPKRGNEILIDELFQIVHFFKHEDRNTVSAQIYTPLNYSNLKEDKVIDEGRNHMFKRKSHDGKTFKTYRFMINSNEKIIFIDNKQDLLRKSINSYNSKHKKKLI